MSLLSKLGLLSVLPLGLALASAGCLASSATEDADRTGEAVAADDPVAGQIAAPPAWSGGYVAPGFVATPPSGTLPGAYGTDFPTPGQFVGSLPGGYGGSLPSTYGSAIPGAIPGAIPSTIPGAFPGELGTSFPPAGTIGATLPGAFGGTMPGVFAGGVDSALPAQYQGLGSYWMDQQSGQPPHWGWSGETSPLYFGDWSGPGFPRYPEGGATSWGSFPTAAAPGTPTPIGP